MSCAQKKETIQTRFEADFLQYFEYQPYYFTQASSYPRIPIISDREPDKVQPMEWCLIPHWTRSPEKAEEIRRHTYNARDDTIFEKPSFRDAIIKNRCLVIADGFFEWHHHPNGRKYPYYIQMKDGGPFAMAGIWSEWKLGDVSKKTFAIVTTDANPMMARIHNSAKRMPLVLPPAAERRWLDPTLPKTEILRLMRPFDEKLMRAHTVSRLISNASAEKNVPEAVAPFDYHDLASTQATLF
jgi:putative SOS response-associated peptidase YedK